MRLLRPLCRRRWSQGAPPPPRVASEASEAPSPDDGEPHSGLAPWSTQYGNLPQRYMLRKSRRLDYITPAPSQCFNNEVSTGRLPDFPLERPWTQDYWRGGQAPHPNMIGHHGVYAQPIRVQDWMWFRGDRVEVLKGKDKGKQGYISYVVQERNWVCVEGLNCKRETVGKTEGFPGMIRLVEQPLCVITDIALVDPMDEKPTEVEWQYTEDGERVRVSSRTGRPLPVPSEAYQTVDYKTPEGYSESQQKDTKAKDVEEITYKPRLATFEMEIMEEQGIQEDRDAKPTFYY